MKGKFKLLSLSAMLSGAALAGRLEISALPPSPYSDTESETNMALRQTWRQARKLNFDIRLEGTVSNIIEVAFGRDTNADGMLDDEESDAAFGWRRGRWYVENVRSWELIETDTRETPSDSSLNIEIKSTPSFSPCLFSAACGGAEAFSPLTGNDPPPWLFDRDWNMLRVSRKGEDADADESVAIKTSNNPLHLIIR